MKKPEAFDKTKLKCYNEKDFMCHMESKGDRIY